MPSYGANVSGFRSNVSISNSAIAFRNEWKTLVNVIWAVLRLLGLFNIHSSLAIIVPVRRSRANRSLAMAGGHKVRGRNYDAGTRSAMRHWFNPIKSQSFRNRVSIIYIERMHDVCRYLRYFIANKFSDSKYVLEAWNSWLKFASSVGVRISSSILQHYSIRI